MKKVLAAVLSLCLLLGTAPALAASLPAWAEGSAAHLKENKVYPSGYSGEIDRLNFLDLLLSTLRAALPDGTLDAVERKPSGYFADAPDTQHWEDRMNLAAGCGITEGTVDTATGARYGNFDAAITRAEAAKMLCAALDFCAREGYEAQAPGQSAVYTDADTVPAWAAPYTGRVAAYGLMKGDDAGRFNPAGKLDWPSSIVMAGRVLDLIRPTVDAARPGVTLRGGIDWTKALNVIDSAVAQPLTGYAKGYYAVSNGDGTLSGVVFPSGSDTFTVERYDGQGNAVGSKSLPMELPIFGTFFDSGDHFYIAFGQENKDKDDGKEVWRVVQYDREWNRLGAVSVDGGDSYTTEPFRSTVSRMAVSEDGKTWSSTPPGPATTATSPTSPS